MSLAGDQKEVIKTNCCPGTLRCLRIFVILAIGFGGISVKSGPVITYRTPSEFFTNVAARLLDSQLSPLNLNLNRIQVYPTNQYTPSVHRLLQFTANLYDSTTNRVLGLVPEYPYCPTVFRPLFRRMGSTTNGTIVIAGYREVLDASMADVRMAPVMIDLDQPNPLLGMIPPYGAAFSPIEKNEPMVVGVPLIIGARKGFPNFNELAMQTTMSVSRSLEFRRAGGNPATSPVIETNQMYVLEVTNTFGIEAWNSYVTNYPRDLQLITSVRMTAVLTNEVGGTANVVFSNQVVRGTALTIPAGSWPGWSFGSWSTSMVLPFGNTNGFEFLPSSTALTQFPWVEPQTNLYSVSPSGAYYVPQWWLNLKTQLLFVLVDTQANRIVDYVNLEHCEPTVDITAKLQEGNTLSTNPLDYKTPANQWITNRPGNSVSSDTPTYGILNQIYAGIDGSTQWQGYKIDPAAGLDVQSAVDAFRYNFGLGPIYPKDEGKSFYKSNVFYAPFDSYRPIYIHTSWQANDPLVHYLKTDLIDLGPAQTNRVNFLYANPPLPNLGRINNRYRPWGGNPLAVDPATDYQVAIKDPGALRSEDWDFPTNQALGVEWVGRVHRGTPWQTVFLKSTNVLAQASGPDLALLQWQVWTGDGLVDPVTSTGPESTNFPDALFTAPTNDWRLISTLNALFNTNSPQQLVSVNQGSVTGWEALLNGLTVITNTSSTGPDFTIMDGNSPQAAIIAQAILQTRSSLPDGVFHDVSEMLGVPELTVASPWLGSSLGSTGGNVDEAIEIIPSQLLPLLRADSMGFFSQTQPSARIQFTGVEGGSYAVQASSNLVDWNSVSTNVPVNGVFYFAPTMSGRTGFYRSRLLP